MRRELLVVFLGVVLTACGGAGSSSDENGDKNASLDAWPPNEFQEADSYGRLIDSTVEGVRYRSGNHYGVTDSDGRFGYIKGETIRFYIGDIRIGEPVAPAELLTPFEISGSNVYVALNIARFLQTLDDDADPENGILINESIHDFAIGKSLEFTGDDWDYEPIKSDNNLLDLLVLDLTSTTSAGSRSLVSPFRGYNHFGNTLGGLADDLESEARDIAAETHCVSDDQCESYELEGSMLEFCRFRGPYIPYSLMDVEESDFLKKLDERAGLVSLKDSLQLAADATTDLTGICIIVGDEKPSTVCSEKNQCEFKH